MITLYQLSSSPFTAKVRRALNYKGLEFQVEEVNRLKAGRGHYDWVSPTRKFPAMDIDGSPVNDSTDIIEALDKHFPEKPLIPAIPAGRALTHVIEEWADESLYFYEMLMRVQWEHNIENSWDEMAETLPPFPKFVLRHLVKKGVTKVTETQGVGRKPREQVLNDAERHIASLDTLLDGTGWLVGDSISVADLAVISQLTKLLYASEIQPMVQRSRNIEDWMQRIDEIAPA